MANDNLFIRDAFASESNLIRIYVNGTSKVSGFLIDSEVGPTSAPQWSNPQSLAETLLGSTGTKAQELIKTPGKLTGKSTVLVQDTLQAYNGNSNTSLNLNFVIIDFEGNRNIPAELAPLNNAANPQQVPANAVGTIIPPLGYEFNTATAQAKGCISIRIGNWFQTPSVFIVDNYSPQYSVVTNDAGRPLYCQVTLSVQTYRNFSASEVQSWYK